VVVRDIAELQRTRADLAAERERFTYLFENLADPVVEVEFVDGEPLVRAQNEAFLRTFDVEPEEVVGRHVCETVAVADASDADPDELVDRIRDGEAVSAGLRAHTVEGNRDFRFRAVPYEVDGPRAFGILVDVTEERRRQRRLEVLNRVLRHNVRNQLTVAMGSAGLVTEEDGIDPADAARLENALEEIASLSEKTRELERLLGETDVRPGDPSPVVREVVADRRQAHPGATIEYDGTAAAVETPAVEHLRPVLDELLENAVVHGEAEPWVRVSVETTDDGVELVVEDDGPGIPEDERAVVTGEVAITQLSHATGLGLWTVEMVVDSMGGSVRFDVIEGGSRVAVELPAAE
jgi:signal transduction histidine kinase